jgi:putative transcriptional regulator
MISYKPFRKLLIDRGLKKKDIMEMTGISQGTMAKMNTNGYVSLEVIDKLCKALKCQPEDLIEYIEEN